MEKTPRKLDPETLRWFACPVCHGGLALEGERVVCAGCGRRYPVVDGIAVLLAERAMTEGTDS